jgi:hypothetical protein
MEEEFPLAPPQPITDSMTVIPVNAHNLLAPSVQVDDNSLPQKPEEYWGCPVLEEVAPMLVEEEVLENVGLNTMVTQSEEAVPELIPQQGFSEEQLHLIFELRRDIADQLHRQEILNRQLDMFFDSFSSEPVKRRFPTYCQPFSFTPAPPHSPPDDGGQGAYGV